VLVTLVLLLLTASVTGTASARSRSSRQSTASDSVCFWPITAFGYTGKMKCDASAYMPVDWNNDRVYDEAFVIAPNRTIWHTWPNSGGWYVMPNAGRADNMSSAGCMGAEHGAVLGDRAVEVWENQTGAWYSYNSGGSWKGWYHDSIPYYLGSDFCNRHM
jgi:hypothetical protein